jgi:transposase, IS6 family
LRSAGICAFRSSYRDVEELLAERGLHADHVTVWRWVQRYAPKIQRRLRPRLRPTNDSWRVDETYIRVKGKWVYLYRAVDSTGATIDFLLSAKRDAAAAERFLANRGVFIFRISLNSSIQRSGYFRT